MACFPSRFAESAAAMVLLAALASLGPSLTSEAVAAAAAEDVGAPWTIDDILLAERAAGFQVSPDGRRAVWVKTAMNKEKGESVSNLVLSGIGGRRDEVALTRGRDRSTGPQWSPGGTTIGFLSTRELLARGEEEDGDTLAPTQLWLIDARGGEPWPLTRLDREILSFAWKDERTIVAVVGEARGLRGQQAAESGDTSRLVETADETPPVRLFAVSVPDGETTRLTENDDWITWVKVSPDGRWAVALHARSLSFRFDNKTPPELKLHDLGAGTVRTLLEGQRVLVKRVEWAPDSKGFYFVHAYSSDPRYFTASIQLLQYVDVENGVTAPVDLHWPRGLGSAHVLPTLDGFLALLADGVRYRPARYTHSGSGWTKQDLSGEHVENLFDWALGQDGRTLVYEHSTASRPPQWYQALLNGGTIEGVTRLTGLNPDFEKRRVHPARVERWTGARDESVEGILYYPFDYERGKKYPLVLSIHGGPTSVDMDRWDQSYKRPKLLLAQKGAFVLEVNYHGSSNYGLEWLESICCGNYAELEPVDLEAAVDHAIQLGVADRKRLASMGWSNGAILTTELITRSRRFKAASIGAGDVEWISDWANVDFGAAFDNYYFGAAPYDDPDLYIRKSPYFRLKDVTTPTILFTGTEDRNVPSSQSWSHFRVMQQASETPVRFVVFPGEAHALRRYVHQKRKIEEDLAWLDQHLFGIAPSPPALKAGSPLSDALERARFAHSGGLYGRRAKKKGPLLPETVSYAGLQVGRFEVTRAQFAAFDPKYPVPPGTGNHPASGITFEQAQAYVAWLATTTSRAWHLPSSSEAAALYGAHSGAVAAAPSSHPQLDENTLDRWAGYSPNPEDATRLREAAAALGGEAPLLTEVGLFRGRGQGDRVFDLDGNVAEWTTGPGGTGALAGGSADLPAGATGPSASPGLGYSGLRVVAGPGQ